MRVLHAHLHLILLLLAPGSVDAMFKMFKPGKSEKKPARYVHA